MTQPKFAGKKDDESILSRGLTESKPAFSQVAQSSARQFAEEAVSESGAEIGVGSSLRRIDVPISVIAKLRDPLIRGMIDGCLAEPASFEAAVGGRSKEGEVRSALELAFSYGLYCRVMWVSKSEMSRYYAAGPGYFENDVFQTLFSLVGEVTFAGARLYPAPSAEMLTWGKGIDTAKGKADLVNAFDLQNKLFATRMLKKAPQWMLKPRAGTITGMVVHLCNEGRGQVVGYTDVVDRAETLMAAIVAKDLLKELGVPGFIYGNVDSFDSALYRMGLKASGK